MGTLKVLLVDDHMVTTPNAGNLTSLSLRTSSNLAEDFHPKHFRELRWASNQFPQPTFIPVSMHWEGPLFSRFSINDMKAIPVEGANDVRLILSEKISYHRAVIFCEPAA
jgi:hypothetical protein